MYHIIDYKNEVVSLKKSLLEIDDNIRKVAGKFKKYAVYFVCTLFSTISFVSVKSFLQKNLYQMSSENCMFHFHVL